MNFMGFLRLYRITGDKTLLHKVAGAWDDIYKRRKSPEVNINGEAVANIRPGAYLKLTRKWAKGDRIEKRR